MSMEPKKGKFAVQINAIATVFQPLSIPRKVQGKSHGMIVPLEIWHDEHECDEVAAFYDGLYIREVDLDEMVKRLGEAIKKSMREKGLVKA